jgi:hypothetical protein
MALITYTNAFDNETTMDCVIDDCADDWDMNSTDDDLSMDWADDISSAEEVDRAEDDIEVTFYNEETGEYEVIDDEEPDQPEPDQPKPDQLSQPIKFGERSVIKTRMGTLIWASPPLPQTKSNLDDKEFPPLGSSPMKMKPMKMKPMKMKPMNISIRISDTTKITFAVKPKETDVQKPAAPKQKPAAPKQKPLCKFIAQNVPCTNKVCRFFHPKGTKQPKAPEPKINEKPKLHSKKLWFCKNIIQTGFCRYGNECLYAHTIKEVKEHVTKCRFGMDCHNVKKTNGIVVNSGPRKCIRLHGKETIDNFIKRMQ